MTELLQMLSGPVGRVTVTVTPVDGLLEVDGVIDRPAHDRDRPGGSGRPGVAPVRRARGRVPGFPAIDRNLDGHDEAAGSGTGRAGDRDWSPALAATHRPSATVMAEVGGVLVKAVWVAGTKPDWSVAG